MAKHKVDITGIKTTDLKTLKNEETVELLQRYKESNDPLILEKIIRQKVNRNIKLKNNNFFFDLSINTNLLYKITSYINYNIIINII